MKWELDDSDQTTNHSQEKGEERNQHMSTQLQTFHTLTVVSVSVKDFCLAA